MTMIKSVKGNPDPLAPFEEKLKDEYGLKIGQYIGSEWFNGSFATSANCNFLTRRDYVRNKRLFVRGEQSNEQYKQHQSRGDNDLDFMNVDWTNINLVEKFCRTVSNGMSEENYRLDIRATDKITAQLKENQKDQYRKELASLPMLKKAKEALGIDLLPKGYLPEDEEEMRLFEQIKDRPKIEISEEILINYIKNTNNWEFIEKQNNKNLTDIGLAGVRVYTDKNDGVKLDYVDPENYVHSYVKRNDFADKYYEGVVDTITLSDLKRESDFSETQLRYIAKTYGSINNSQLDFYNCELENIIDFKVDVLRFAFKTSKTTVYKKKIRGGKTIKLSKRDENFIAPERSDVGVVSKTLDTWLEGNYVIGTNAIYGYKECENLERDLMNKAMSPFIFMATDIYENVPRSFLSNIEPIANQMQNIALKLQNFLAELKGDITEIDLDLLAELDDGKGGPKKQVWQTALKLLQVKNIVFKKRIDLGEMGIKEASAVKTYPSGSGGHISALLNSWAFKYNLIRDITGINPAADGSLSEDALYGVSQMAKLAANTTTKHILDTSISLNKKVCETISTRIKSVYTYKEAAHIKEIYTNVVGEQLFDALDVLKNRHLHEFGFTFEVKPTGQELKEFNDDLALALQEGNIDPEVKIQATIISKVNIKLAIQYLMFHRRKRIKTKMEEQMALSKSKSQNDAMAAQSKAQSETQSYAIKKQADLQYASQLAQIEIQKAQALKQIEAPFNDKAFEQEVYLEKIKSLSKFDMENFKEDRKDERTKIQATQQSKMKQATDNDAPIDFKNEFDFTRMFK